MQDVQPGVIGLDQEYVLSHDLLQEEQGNVLWAAMLTRCKNNSVYLHFWSCVAEGGEAQFKLLLKSEIKVQYPKIMNDKVKNAQKAAMTIKLLSPTHLLLSGKLG